MTTPLTDHPDPTKEHGTPETPRQPTQASLEAAEAQAQLGSWQYDPATDDGFWTKEMYALLGRDRALGRPSAPEFFDLFHPDDRSALLASQNPEPWTGNQIDLHVRSNPARGPMRFLHMIVRAIRDQAGRMHYLAGTLQDETEQKIAERAMVESEARYRFLFENNPAPMLVYELGSLRMLAVNEAFIHHYGYSREEALGLRLTDLYPSDDEKARISALIPTLRGYANVGEWHHRRRDGSVITIVATSHDLPFEGRRARVAVIIDITERKRAEEALRHAHNDLERRVQERTRELAVAKERAEAADRIKSAFLATMSHELRTPLNSIIGFTGILLQDLAGPLNPEQRKQLGMVQGSARHLHALINDVLDFSKIEAGQLEIRVEGFDPRDLIDRAVESVRPEAERKGLRLRIDAPDPLPRMTSDRRRVAQVLLNLLQNAIKFTETGEVVVTASPVPDFHPRDGGSAGPALCVGVRDTGIGIKAEDLPLLFRAFRQIDSGLTRLHEGTGLGLAISRRVADLLGGEIAVESAWGRGSTFSFTLPLSRQSPP